MAYGILKCDQITFTNGGIDQTVTVSGIVQSISGNITATGTIQAATIIGTSTVSGATVTGDSGQYGNLNSISGVFTTQVSGATVTGNAGSFTTVTGGVATITSGVFALGTNALPSISFSSDPNTGIYSPGADQVTISTNGTGRLFIDANGQIAAGASLDASISVDTRVLKVGGLNYLAGTNGTSGKQNFKTGLFYNALPTGSATANAIVSNAGSDYLPARYTMLQGAHIWETATSATAGAAITWAERLRITSAGQLSHIGAGSSGSPAVGFNGSAPSNSLVVDSTGKVGLGTSSPSSLLNLSGSSPKITLTSTSTGADSILDATSSFGSIWIGADENNEAGSSQIVLAVDGSPKVNIKDTGNVGVGTTSPVARFETNVTSDGAESARFRISGLTNNPIMRFVHHESVGTQIDLNGTTANATQLYVTQVGTERLRIDSSGRLLVGTSTSATIGSSTAGKFQLADTTLAIATLGTYANNGNGSVFVLGKSRSSGPGTYAIVQSGDLIGSLRFAGDDGTDYVTQAANIEAYVDGTPGANDMPGRLVFSTTADGASSPTERLRITSAGVLQIADAGNIAVGTTTGTKIGTATTQKLGFFNKTPVVQPAAVADATDAASVITQLNALLARMRDLGLIAT